jgi:hypothetical protein
MNFDVILRDAALIAARVGEGEWIGGVEIIEKTLVCRVRFAHFSLVIHEAAVELRSEVGRRIVGLDLST